MAAVCSPCWRPNREGDRAMHASTIITRELDCCWSMLHAKRAQALRAAVLSLLMGGALNLCGIARCVHSPVAMRHRVKRVDRLLGNLAVSASRYDLYEAVAERWLTGLKQILIVVDWSVLTHDQRWHLLRAAVPVEGRSVTLYEEVHPQRRYGHSSVHWHFVERIARMIPTGCRVIVMTDAGFRSSWFRLVAAQGWDWIGRIRHRDLIQGADGEWFRATALYPQASGTARDLGLFHYVRKHPTRCRLVLVKQAPKGRHSLTIYGIRRQGRRSRKNARRQRGPWLLASSIGLEHLAAQVIVKLYAHRMRIEQAFRDTKNLRFGMGLSTSRSRGRLRLETLLLLAHLASFVLRLIGESAIQQQLELQFQSTNRRSRREISVITLARRLMNDATHSLNDLRPWNAIRSLAEQARYACSFT